MLMGNDCHNCSKYNRLEMKNVNKDIVSWLEDIVEENTILLNDTNSVIPEKYLGLYNKILNQDELAIARFHYSLVPLRKFC